VVGLESKEAVAYASLSAFGRRQQGTTPARVATSSTRERRAGHRARELDLDPALSFDGAVLFGRYCDVGCDSFTVRIVALPASTAQRSSFLDSPARRRRGIAATSTHGRRRVPPSDTAG
jgi:hypothetical protein